MLYKKYEFAIVRNQVELDMPRVESPAQAVELFAQFADEATKESLFVLIVDGRNGLVGVQELYRGTATGTSVRIAEIFTPILLNAGVGFVLVHNHPSGDHEPSEEDAKLTQEVIRASKLLDIQMLDHLVIGSGGFSSIRSQRPSLWEEEENV